MMKRLVVFAALVGLAAISFAQDRQPRGEVDATVNGSKVMVEYGRPALKGRSLDELMKNLPEDRIWRTGENQVTTLETQAALKIGGKSIPAGKYSLYVYAPAEGNWGALRQQEPRRPAGRDLGPSSAGNGERALARAARLQSAHRGRRNRAHSYDQEIRGVHGCLHHRVELE